MKGVRGFPLAPFLYLNCIMYTNTLSPMKLAFENLAHAVFLPLVAFAACGILPPVVSLPPVAVLPLQGFGFSSLARIYTAGVVACPHVSRAALFRAPHLSLTHVDALHNVKQAVADSSLPALFTRSLKL